MFTGGEDWETVPQTLGSAEVGFLGVTINDASVPTSPATAIEGVYPDPIFVYFSPADSPVAEPPHKTDRYAS